MKKYTIEDLAQGRCAVINDGSVEELREVLRRAFPDDCDIPTGSSQFYRRSWADPRDWGVGDLRNLPTQSVKDFLVVEEEQLFQYEYKWYDVREVLPDERFDGVIVGTICDSINKLIVTRRWNGSTGAFNTHFSGQEVDDVLYWCPLPTLPQ
jgi:hypothetical protein